ncbi:MAG: tetratricopeptide repeat protein [Candidatus Omnitrophica bacterium]|nr:tetratricopeptide repeat protein [Candidatus Omnitrophota bacterium]
MTVYFIILLPSAISWAEEASPYARAAAAYQDRRLDEALSYAEEAVREEPGHVEAHLLLGQLYYLRQDLEKARESWEQALKLAPSRRDVRERLEKLQKEAPLERGLSRNDTAPFVVRFAQDQIGPEREDLRPILQETYRQVGQSFQYFPDYPITVILYPASSFEQVKGISHRVAGLYDGKIRLPIQSGGPVQSGPGDALKAILWHEYTHALVHDLAKGRCPVWLNEGIATLQEARVRPIDLRLARGILDKGKPIPWEQLWKEEYDQGDLELHYAQGYLITQYLVKRFSWPDLVGLLKLLGQGYPIVDALRAQYKEAPVALEKEWLSWLNRQ